jgi:hypothetical protein
VRYPIAGSHVTGWPKNFEQSLSGEGATSTDEETTAVSSESTDPTSVSIVWTPGAFFALADPSSGTIVCTHRPKTKHQARLLLCGAQDSAARPWQAIERSRPVSNIQHFSESTGTRMLTCPSTTVFCESTIHDVQLPGPNICQCQFRTNTFPL